MLRIARWQHPAIASCLTRQMLARSLAMASRGRAKTITAGMHSDLRITDPGLTTRDHGYMVYDMLLARDSEFEIPPSRRPPRGDERKKMKITADIQSEVYDQAIYIPPGQHS